MRFQPTTVLLLALAVVTGAFLASVTPVNIQPQGSTSVAAQSTNASGASGDARASNASAFDFGAPIALGGTSQFRMQATCQDVQCGGGEPVLEIAGNGDIYVSATCCVGAGPPVWVSRNAGQSYVQLVGGPAKDLGVEGDLAIDDAGNVYFSDTSVASLYLTSWTQNGTYRYTVPACPCPPIVDRPWVRAGAANTVYFLYNTGSSTRFLSSADGGVTWTPGKEFPAPLGNIGQGPQRDDLWVVANLTLWKSTDGGATWSQGVAVPTPSVWGRTFQAFQVPVVDSAGNAWVVYDWTPNPNGSGPYAIYADRLDPSGHWHGPYQVSPEMGTHAMPWAAAGRAGTLAVAWYGAPTGTEDPNHVGNDTAWYVYAGVTVNGTSEHPTFLVQKADPRPVLHGPLQRNLWDFLQTEIHPDGSLVIAYADRHDGRGYPMTDVVKSTTALHLAPATYPNGPEP